MAPFASERFDDMSTALIQPGTDEVTRQPRISFRDSNLYDVLARLPLVAWFALTGVAMGRHLISDFAAVGEGVAGGFGVDAALNAVAHAAGLAFVLFVIGALSLRRRPLARTVGLLPRLVAIGGAFSITGLALFPKVALSPVVAGASVAMMLIGYGVSCYAIRHLGRSLSLMAEARDLVTTGPYALVRHPLYVAEALASLGLLLQFLSWSAAFLWVIHIALQLSRMRYEERILRQIFPEYDDYARRTSRLVPGVY